MNWATKAINGAMVVLFLINQGRENSDSAIGDKLNKSRN